MLRRSPVRLYCFAHAGASAACYRRWQRALPDWLLLDPIELPGHGSRSREPLCRSMDALISGLLSSLLPTHPFALFGHSLGALVAFEFARRLESRGGPSPLVVFASSSHSPSFDRNVVPTTEAGLREQLVEFEGTPRIALQDRELMELVLPVLQADYAIGESYRQPPSTAAGFAIHALGGTDDTVSRTALEEWRVHTRSSFDCTIFPGGHFYLREQQAPLLGLVVQVLERACPSEGMRSRPDQMAKTGHSQLLRDG